MPTPATVRGAMYVSQSISPPLGVTVFGSHLLRADPDYAAISFAIDHVAAAPKAAMAAAAASRAAVANVLSRRKLSAADVTTSHVGLELAVDGFGKDRHVLGYRAQVDYDIRCHDLEAVPELIIELVDAGAKTVHGVRYQSSKVRELRAKAREYAFASARVKADGYAKTAGLTIGRVLHIEDVNPDSLVRRGHAGDVDVTGHAEFDSGSAGSVAIAGAVMVCFSIVEP